jgi:Fe-S-cluster containining protein
MSKKTAQKRKEKRKAAKKGGGSVMKKRPDKKPVTLREKLQDLYNMINLETTCCRQSVCCLVACPQMNYSEATQIINTIWSEWSLDDKRKLIVKCLRYYYSNSLVKACPLLGKTEDGNLGCRVYKDRPLNCRLFGLWPKDSYERRVKGFERATKFKRKDLPLNTQCSHVKRVDDSVELTDQVIDALASSLDFLDESIGEYTKEQIEKRNNYMTIHDWIMIKVFGDENMAMLTDYLLAATEDEIEDYLDKQEAAIMEMNV